MFENQQLNSYFVNIGTLIVEINDSLLRISHQPIAAFLFFAGRHSNN
jgi:hypothetical protein